jgi:hypothetical protein
MHILVDKDTLYMVEELNFCQHNCQHKWLYVSENPKDIFSYVVAKKLNDRCDTLSVISKTLTSINVESYPVWAKKYL